MDQELQERASRIRLAVFDVDGVMTDGRIYFTDDGREMKAFCTHDGLGLKLLQKTGITVAVITGRNSPIVAHRMAELGINHVYQGRRDKRETFDGLLAALHLEASQASYMGDDLPDLPLLRRAGLAAGVPNGHSLLKDHLHWISPRPGGSGAARDLCDLLLEAQGAMEAVTADYL